MIEDFIAETERLLAYISRTEKGDLAVIGPARRLAKKQGLGFEQVENAIRVGVRKKTSTYLRKISEGEDAEIYISLIRDLAEEHCLDRVELEEKIARATREAELGKLALYINMIENANIHLASKARAIQGKYGLKGSRLEEAIRRGEAVYLFRNIKQIKKGPRFHPLLPSEEKLLREIASKHGHEAELEEAIKEWKKSKCHAE
jgi:hypothetical protein